MNHSTSGLPIHHHLPELPQTHVHWVSDAIQPFHLLSSPSPPVPGPSQHQGLFQSSTLHMRWPQYWSFSFSISPSMKAQDWSPLRWTAWIYLQSNGLSKVFSSTAVQKAQFFGAQLSSHFNSHIHTWNWKERKKKKNIAWPDWPLLAEYWLCFLLCSLGCS